LFACWLQRTRPGTAPSGGDHVETREDHVAFHADHGNAGRADFVFASVAAQDLGELPGLATHDAARDLRVLVERIRAAGERVLIADLTSPDVRALGVTVVRAVITGFHPLVFGHRLRALGGARLWRVPQALGHPGITPAGGDNPVPHPFP